MITKFSAFVSIVFFTLMNVYADLQSDIIPTTVDTITGSLDGGSFSLLDNILEFVRDSIFGLLGLIAIGMFLYIGFLLVKAQGNPEEMKKAFMTLIHVVIGLFIVAFSWAAVKLVSGITF